jgi:hypothetical protein
LNGSSSSLLQARYTRRSGIQVGSAFGRPLEGVGRLGLPSQATKEMPRTATLQAEFAMMAAQLAAIRKLRGAG